MTEKRSGPEANSQATYTLTETTRGNHHEAADRVHATAGLGRWCVCCRTHLVRPESIRNGICLTCRILTEAVAA